MPLAAQLACTPVVAAISGQVSLVAVATNVLVAPAVGPATVLGLAGGLLGLRLRARRPGGRHARRGVRRLDHRGRRARCGAPRRGHRLGDRRAVAGVLTALVVGLALASPRLLRRPVTGLGCCLVLVVAVLVRPARPRVAAARAGCWSPATSARATRWCSTPGRRAAVVVDAGPDAAAVDGCLDRLDVRAGPAAGAHPLPRRPRRRAGGRAGRPRGRRAWWSPGCSTRRRGSTDVLERRHAPRASCRATPASARTATYGPVALQVLWPLPGPAGRGPGDGSTANDASVVLLAETAGCGSC